MKHVKAAEINARAVRTTDGLSVALYLSANLPVGDGSIGFRLEHQKLMIQPGAEDIYHFHKMTYELFTVEQGSPTAVVNGVDIPLARGDSILMEPGDEHRLCNRTDRSVTVVETRFNVCAEDRYEL